MNEVYICVYLLCPLNNLIRMEIFFSFVGQILALFQGFVGSDLNVLLAVSCTQSCFASAHLNNCFYKAGLL